MGEPPGVVTGVLTNQEILDLCGLGGQGGDPLEESGSGPIKPCRRKNVRSASYDLRLGKKFHAASALGFEGQFNTVSGLKVSELREEQDETIFIPPNEVVVVACLERLCMPDDMVGHLTLKQDILLQGLIMASQSQIDAGYEGSIFALFYNLTDAEVSLKYDDSILRLELVRLKEDSLRPYDGDYRDAPLSKVLKGSIRSSLAKIHDDVATGGKEVEAAKVSMADAQGSMEDRITAAREGLESRFERVRLFSMGTLLAAIAVLVAVGTSFNSDLGQTREKVARLEAESGSQREVKKLQAELAALRRQVRVGSERVGRLEQERGP